MNKKNTRKGFTITELVIVIAVIAILAAVLIPTFTAIISKANASADLQEVRNAYQVLLSETEADALDDIGDLIVNGEHTTVYITDGSCSLTAPADTTGYAEYDLVDGELVAAANNPDTSDVSA